MLESPKKSTVRSLETPASGGVTLRRPYRPLGTNWGVPLAYDVVVVTVSRSRATRARAPTRELVMVGEEDAPLLQTALRTGASGLPGKREGTKFRNSVARREMAPRCLGEIWPPAPLGSSAMLVSGAVQLLHELRELVLYQ